MREDRDALLAWGYMLDVREVLVRALFDAREQQETLAVSRVHWMRLHVQPRVF
jgi:hypothetical protein